MYSNIIYKHTETTNLITIVIYLLFSTPRTSILYDFCVVHNYKEVSIATVLWQ